MDEISTLVLLLLLLDMLWKCCSDSDWTPDDDSLLFDLELTSPQRVFDLRI